MPLARFMQRCLAARRYATRCYATPAAAMLVDMRRYLFTTLLFLFDGRLRRLRDESYAFAAPQPPPAARCRGGEVSFASCQIHVFRRQPS